MQIPLDPKGLTHDSASIKETINGYIKTKEKNKYLIVFDKNVPNRSCI